MAKGLIPISTQKNTPSLWQADYQKVQLFLQGQESAWEELYRQTYPIAVGMLKKQWSFRLLQEKDILDVVNEAFQRCFLKAASFQGTSRFSTWVCGFVRYVALETVRKKYLWEIKPQGLAFFGEQNRHSRGPESLLILKERNTRLWLAFDSLSLRHRLLLRCFVLKWYPHAEIRKKAGLRQTEIKSELNRACRVLRNRFLSIYPSDAFLSLSQRSFL